MVCPSDCASSSFAERDVACVAGEMSCYVSFFNDGDSELTFDSIPEAPGCFWDAFKAYPGYSGGCGLGRTLSQRDYDAAFLQGTPINVSASFRAVSYINGIPWYYAITATQLIDVPVQPLLDVRGLRRTYAVTPEGGRPPAHDSSEAVEPAPVVTPAACIATASVTLTTRVYLYRHACACQCCDQTHQDPIKLHCVSAVLKLTST